MTVYGGFASSLYITGASTAMTTEACSLVSGKTYQIDDADKRVWDPDTAIVVWDDGSPVSASNIESIDYLFGTVTFTSGYSVVGAITINSGSYLPLLELTAVNAYSLNLGSEMIDTTVMGASVTARKRIQGLKNISGTIGGFDSAVDDYDTGGGTVDIGTLLLGGTNLVLEINLGNTGNKWRGWVVLDNEAFDPSVDGSNESVISFQGTAEEAASPITQGISYSFGP